MNLICNSSNLWEYPALIAGSTSAGGTAISCATATADANHVLNVSGAIITTSDPILNLTQTWNAGAVAFTGLLKNVTNTASASGSLLINLEVGGTSEFKVDESGNTYATTLILSSDQSLKHDIKSPDSKTALDFLSALPPVSCKWNSSGQPDLGLIAQEVETVYPELVGHGVNDKLAVESNSLIAPIIASIQELKEQNDQPAKKNTALRGDVEELKAARAVSPRDQAKP